jgi:molybdopterin synthase sulfur carrier subunit
LIRVILPHHLRRLAGVTGELTIDVRPGATQSELIDRLELHYPELRGTIRDPATGRRRPFVRFFAGGDDLSHDPPDTPLPPDVVAGSVLFSVVGAMAGG